ncbi:hypothetical protein GGR28_002185 [Lewinella aquimaris]|uniref:DUF4861 domain-containing protein n=1 Tax=Neolewinella aquimaris TaxID=1835722 RepID=A0A840E393_9BACT|nr:DUF4861 family protein [Neolewinella aquimaris]MBB4079560.1 hypothetical protein [Neolewinella aquimaris]
MRYLLCSCVPALLLLTSCEEEPTNVATEQGIEQGTQSVRTNIRLAKRNAQNEFEEGTEFTRAPDHKGQIMPAVYQNEGPAWENENIAFRMYWDERNGIDIHGKKVSDMVLDTVGLDRNNYHEMSDWGMDVLKAGNSLGAGSIALMVDGKVYRIGDARQEKVRITEETADRSAFHLDYDGLEIAGRTIDLDWVISIEAGTHDYDATVTATGLTGGEELVVGIVNLHSDTLYTTEKGDRFVAYTHGPQAELDHYLGMAISVDRDQFIDHGELAPDAQPVSSTYIVRAKLTDGEPTGYRFTAGWAPGHPEFERREAFEEVIR